jgi:hypothetical protein
MLISRPDQILEQDIMNEHEGESWYNDKVAALWPGMSHVQTL